MLFAYCTDINSSECARIKVNKFYRCVDFHVILASFEPGMQYLENFRVDFKAIRQNEWAFINERLLILSEIKY